MLAIEGLDWEFLQQLADRGRMPMISSLINAGVCARLDFPIPECADSGWASVACGVLPDRHGLLHSLAMLPASLFPQTSVTTALRTPAMWDWADQAEMPCAVIGWPATHGLRLRHGWSFAAGLEVGLTGAGTAWPLAPDAVHPPALRELVHEARMSAEEIALHDIEFFLAGFAPDARALLATPLATALARCVTLHALGTAMVEQHGTGMLMLRLSLPAAIATLLQGQQNTAAASLCIERCYQFLDMVCGRYFQLAGPGAVCTLMSNGQRANQGFIVMAGPGIAGDKTVGPLSACDVLPTLAAALSLPLAAGLDGKVMDDVFTAVPEASAALDFQVPPPLRQDDILSASKVPPIDPTIFEREGLPLPDYAPQRAFLTAVECETRLALANMAVLRGQADEAIKQLSMLVVRFPEVLILRIRLAEQLLLAGNTSACEALVQEFPLVQQEGPWADAVYGILALVRLDYEQAARRLAALAQLPHPPINPHLWLGRMHEAQGAWPDALSSYALASTCSPQDAEAWSGLGRASLACGRHPQAAMAYGRAVSLQPRSAQALMGLAKAWDACGDTAKGASARARAMKANSAVVGRDR